MPPGADIASNLEVIGRRLRAAAARSGRNPDDILLVAVSKTVPPDIVREAAAAGQRHFGENRVQEGMEKISATGDLQLEWHLIGHLQSNKAKKAAAAFAWIHSIDSLELLRKVDTAATEAGAKPRILVQVDLAHEATKFGADEAAAGDIAKAAMDAKNIELRGLMIVPPIADDPEQSRPWFRRLRDLRDALVSSGIPAANLAHLSMGMSHDFEVAIGEGATMIRIGTSIFGLRAPVA
jgi:pyridoxal phosphate enzyme (YggS family)